MEKRLIAGVKINRVPLKRILTSKTIFVAAIFLLFALIGTFDVVSERYLLHTANAADAGLHPGSAAVAEAMKEAVFGGGSEVKRESPWTLYIVNYMYMLYTGSAIIFLVSLGELLGIDVIKRTAAGFMTLGLAMVFGGLFTISADLNILHLHWMFLNPQPHSGMWLMLPLYLIYIPLVLFEIYLLLTKQTKWIRKVAFALLIVGIAVEVAEFYIQAKLFTMNEARHLWTTYPFLMLYFMISAFAAASAVMLLYTLLVYAKQLNEKCFELLALLKETALLSILALGAYEATASVFIDQKWRAIILYGDHNYLFYTYIALTVGIPFMLLYGTRVHRLFIALSAILIITGSYIGRLIFVYGGNAYPMSDRFGTGFEKYGEYEPVKQMILELPSRGELFVVLGSIGVMLLIYKLFDLYLDVSKTAQHTA